MTERLRSGKSGRPRARDTTNRYSYSGERKVGASNSQATLAAREYRLKRRSQTFDSASSSPETLRNPDREKRLNRAQTDPASVSDEGSLSRESSISSFDHSPSLLGSSPKLEEESSTIRTQCSSKTNDSGILTFVSTDRRENFCLDSPLDLLHPSEIESYEAPALSARVGAGKADDKLSQEILKNPSTVTSSALEIHQLDKGENNRRAVHSRSTDNSGFREITRKASKKNKAPSPPCSISPDTLLHDSTVEVQLHSSNQLLTNLEAYEEKHTSHTNIEVTRSEHADIESSVTDKTLEIKDITRLSGVEVTPQRPPRLKKRSVSERSHDLPSPTSPTATADTVATYTVTSQSNSIEEKSLDSCLSVPSSKASEITSIQQQTVNGQTPLDRNVTHGESLAKVSLPFDNTLQKISKTRVDIDERNKEEPISSNTTLVLTEHNSDRSVDTLTNITNKEASAKDMATQMETMVRLSQSSIISSSPESTNKHTFSDFSKEQISSDDDFTSGRYDTDMEGIPPPLPSSAPPPLPTDPPPMIGNNGEPDVIIVEYSVPIIPSINGVENNTLSQKDESVASSVQVNQLTKTHLNNTALAAITASRKVSLPDDRTDKEPQIESPSTPKTLSDLRSDFFGLKSRRPHNDVLEPMLTDTSTNLSREFYFNDLQRENKFNKLGIENSLDSDISDADSGVPLSVGDETFSPGEQ